MFLFQHGLIYDLKFCVSMLKQKFQNYEAQIELLFDLNKLIVELRFFKLNSR